MNEKNAFQGLACPRCGGTVKIPEGQAIVICPYCNLRSVVKGDHGVRRYQVLCKIDRSTALNTYDQFFKNKFAVAKNVAREAKVTEAFIIHLPFWTAWGKALGWGFGQVQVGSGDHKRFEPRETKVVEEVTWNGAACEVGEFGVNRISLENRPLDPFNAEQLHQSGLVFEPVGSAAAALQTAQVEFEQQIRQRVNMDKLSQLFVRVIQPRLGLVYYPLWVIRYLYRGRSFQVVVDGFSGEILYAKAPGNVLYRALALVGGMAAGAFIAVDVSALAISNGDSEGAFTAALFAFVIGMGLMYTSWRVYRYREHYEYQRYRDRMTVVTDLPASVDGQKLLNAASKIGFFR
ncbi:MAG: hypothetical protein ABFD29_02390 [Anaerolineaceae bacterium]